MATVLEHDTGGTGTLDEDDLDSLKAHRRHAGQRRIARQDGGSVWRDAVGWITVLFGVGFLLALVSYNPNDPSFFTETSQHLAENLLGTVGAQTSAFCMQLFGFGSYFVPLILIYFGVQLIRERGIGDWFFKAFGACMIWFSLLVVLGGLKPVTYKEVPLSLGGSVGIDLWVVLSGVLNAFGTYLLLLTLSGLALLLATQWTLGEMGAAIMRGVRRLGARIWGLWQSLRGAFERRKRQRMDRQIIQRSLKRLDAQETPAKAGPREAKTPVEPPKRRPRAADESPAGSATIPSEMLLAENQSAPAPDSGEIKIHERQKNSDAQNTLPGVDEAVGQWVFPASDFFDEPQPEHQIDPTELRQKSKVLMEKFEEFGVTGTIKDIYPGPVVTTYEFKPDAGIKYSRIVNLQDDLCLALGAESIRIDRMPGKSSVGLEVPNRKRETIMFRELIESTPFKREKSNLFLALGKTIDGSPYFANFGNMPHLLIAGQTGSGKSVAINGMICSILMRNRPDEVKLILIDPKMVEMGIYADIPHLLTPVVIDPEEAANALKWAVVEMDLRFKMLASYNFRNLQQYNMAVQRGKIQAPEEEDLLEQLPYVVVVIDELADLMMVARGEVEESIARIAQKSRAVGIHLILATQRPSVDILTGVIKSNLPARLSYRVSQRNDSRIILDANGAEKLLGRGDGLFLPPGTSRLVRIHAPLITETEILGVVNHLKKQGRPDFNHAILRHSEAGEGGGADGLPARTKDDPMYDQAARLVVRSGQASVSYLQRKLGLGYARAAKLVDMMEDDGIVGPHVGSKARDILVPGDYFDEIDSQLR